MTPTRQTRLRAVPFPAIGFPAEPRPEIPPRIFSRRLARVRQRMAERRLEALVVYGDREHFATLAWLTNYDPRFEESLLIVFPTGTPILFVGNEGLVYSNVARLQVTRQLYQTFSLLGQPREKVKPLTHLLRDVGLGRCARVGTAGWKYFAAPEVDNPEEALDVPDFIARSLRQAVRAGGRVTNETALFLDPQDGLRQISEPEQIADFEWVATHNSQGLLLGLRGLRPGLTEMQAFANMRTTGLPWCCHPVCTTADELRRSMMASPSSRKIRRGDPIFMTCAYQGANVCRFGWVARGPQDLPAAVRDYVAHAAAPYFDALAAWYETMRVGATGDALHHAVWDRLTPLGFGLGLNCGHQIATDEWTHSFVAAGNRQQVRSGMYWQADFFAMLPTPHFGAFAEDGVIVADAKLRRVLARRYPRLWRRVSARRRFMVEQLGVNLAADVLPVSNFPATVIPFFLASDHCLVRCR